MGFITVLTNGVNLVLLTALSFFTLVLYFMKRQYQKELQALKQRELRMAQLLSATKDSLVLIDREGRMISESLNFKSNPSMKQGEFPFLYWEEIHPDDIKFIKGEILSVFIEGRSRTFECRVKNETLNWMYVEVIASPIYTEARSIDEVVLDYRDISTRKEYEQKINSTLKDLQDIKFALDEATLVQIVDKKANILYANDRFCQLSGYALGELLGENMRILNSQYHSKKFFRELWAKVSQGEVWRGDMKNRSKDGTIFWVSTTIVPFLDKNNKPYQYIVIRNDITKSKENEEKLEYLSNVDGLTSLFNRRYFDMRFQYYWELQLVRKLTLSVIMFDVDYFKYYNDHYGHIMGDKCLIDISNRVKLIVDQYEAISARVGGEEFAVILPEKDIIEAYEIAEDIRTGIMDLCIPHERSKINNIVTMSFGVASITPDVDFEPKEMLKVADQALYLAKKNGRNNTQIKDFI